MNGTPYIPELLKQDKPSWALGVHDVISTKVAEKAGYEAGAVQSLQVSFSNGLPDVGGVTASQRSERANARAHRRSRSGMREATTSVSPSPRPCCSPPPRPASPRASRRRLPCPRPGYPVAGRARGA